MMIKIRLQLFAGVVLASFLTAGCVVSSAPEDNYNQTSGQQAGYQVNDYNRLTSPYSAIPSGSDLQYLRLTHLMTGSDKVCVVNSGDFSDGQYVVRNSGSYVQRSIADNLSQHGNAVVLLEGSDPTVLHDRARENGCTIIAATRLLSWRHNPDGSPFISIRLDMFDTSSLSLMNSVRFTAVAANDSGLYDESKGVLKPLIALYIHKLYQN